MEIHVKAGSVLVGKKLMQPNPCKSMKCQNKCGNIDETTQKKIFDLYYVTRLLTVKKFFSFLCEN